MIPYILIAVLLLAGLTGYIALGAMIIGIITIVLICGGLTAFLTFKYDNARVDAYLRSPEGQAETAEYNKRYGIKPKQ